MNVTISARHCEIPNSLRTATERRIARLSRYNPRLAEAEVTYEVERVSHEVEIRLAVDGDAPVVARASGTDFRAALARGLDRARRQLRRLRERRRVRSATPTPTSTS
jgi:ribosomal subunit interface protein